MATLARVSTLLRRDLGAAELRLMWFALVLAATVLSGLGFLAERVDVGLRQDAAALLGGQLVVDSDHALPPAFGVEARAAALNMVHIAEFPTMALGVGVHARAHLVSLKAVDAAYPLFGAVALQGSEGGRVRDVRGGPQPGTVWVARGLGARLGAGRLDRIRLGAGTFRIAGVIASEPDGTGIAFAPRVMINMADLDATGLLQPASRVRWRLALRGAPDAVARYAAWARANIDASAMRGVHLQRANDADVGDALRRGASFLQVVALGATLLAALATAIAARDFAQRRRDMVALLKALGLTRGAVMRMFMVELGVLGAVAAGVGCLAGLGLQALVLRLLGGLLGAVTLPSAGWRPVASAFGVVWVLLLAFALAPLHALAGEPPMRVLRPSPGRRVGWWQTWAGALLCAVVLAWMARDHRLALIALSGAVAVALALGASAAGVVWLARRAGQRGHGTAALAARQLGARRAQAVIQVGALGLALMAMLLVAILRDGLTEGWRQSLPPDAPTRFAINIQPDQTAAFQGALRQAGVARFDWYSMVRARLVGVNGHAVFGRNYPAGRARALVEREFNLSTSPTVPDGNTIVAGNWRAHGLSVDAGIADTLGLKLGDRLAFDVAGTRIDAPITSLRRVDWTSLRVNFFVLAPVVLLKGLPSTRITAFFEPPGTTGLDTRLAQAFPDVTVIDIGDVLARIRAMLDQLVNVVQLLFAGVLGAGLAVVVAMLRIQRGERAREAAIWRMLGARAGMLRRVLALELTLLGAVAGALGATAALVLGTVLAREVFSFTWTPGGGWVLGGVIGGASLALITGWISLAPVLRTPPMRLLRGGRRLI